MEQVIQVTVLCVIGALICVLLKQTDPEMALLVAVATAVVVFLVLSGLFGELMEFMSELSKETGVSQKLLSPLYKTLGIALVVKIGGNLCRDAGESALASVIETAGSICALLVSVPLLQSVLSMLLELMKK